MVMHTLLTTSCQCLKKESVAEIIFELCIKNMCKLRENELYWDNVLSTSHAIFAYL